MGRPGKTVFKKEERKIKKDSGFSGQGARRCDPEVAHKEACGGPGHILFLELRRTVRVSSLQNFVKRVQF